MFSIIDPSILVAMIRKYWKVSKEDSIRWYFSTIGVSVAIAVLVNVSAMAGMAFLRLLDSVNVTNAIACSSIAFVLFFAIPVGSFMRKLVFGKYSGVNAFNVKEVLEKIDFKKSKVAQNTNIAVFCFFQTIVFSAIMLVSKWFSVNNSDSVLSAVYDFSAIMSTFILVGVFYAGILAMSRTLRAKK